MQKYIAAVASVLVLNMFGVARAEAQAQRHFYRVVIGEGRTLTLHCEGVGSPLVVLEATDVEETRINSTFSVLRGCDYVWAAEHRLRSLKACIRGFRQIHF